MATLPRQQLADRLRLDFTVVMKMRCPIMNVSAYRNADDLKKLQNPIVSEEEGQLATHYLVDYFVKTLIGPGSYSDKTSVHIDLLGNGNYPYSSPLCWVISATTPWSPHFRPGVPICISHELWVGASGGMLLGALLVHIAKLLNFDEIPRSDTYGGYNPEAAEYWRSQLNRQPINPHLLYPPLPAEIASLRLPSFVNRILGVRKDSEPKRPLRVFLCHSSGDKEIVRKLYTRLCANGIDAWLDEKKLLPGQKWEVEIPKAVKNSDVVIVCLSNNAIDKSGYIQKEILIALNVADEKPEIQYS